MRKAMADRKAAGKLSDQQLKKAAKKKAEERGEQAQQDKCWCRLVAFKYL
jgi:hypothetical protein